MTRSGSDSPTCTRIKALRKLNNFPADVKLRDSSQARRKSYRQELLLIFLPGTLGGDGAHLAAELGSVHDPLLNYRDQIDVATLYNYTLGMFLFPHGNIQVTQVKSTVRIKYVFFSLP